MVDATYTSYRADDRSLFSILKKDIRELAHSCGMDRQRLHNLDIILSEMTSNLLKYGQKGEIIVGDFDDGNAHYFEVVCLDHGRGMADTETMTTDGLSTSGTMGIGLGSIKRLSDHFEIFSQKDWGTVVLSRLWLRGKQTVKNLPLVVKPMILKMPGQQVSGDGTFYKYHDGIFYLLVADGLGHGPLAREAVQEAAKAFGTCKTPDPVAILRMMHESIRKTRGMVATVCTYHLEKKVWKVAGIGNIVTKFYNYPKSKNVMAYNGIIGHTIPRTINEQQIDGNIFNQVTFCSDGIQSKWDLNKLPGIGRHDLSIQAAAIYKDYGRQTDDMSVVMVKAI